MAEQSDSNSVQAQPAVLRATIHITRAVTGKVETFEIVGTPAEVKRLSSMGPTRAVQALVQYQKVNNPMPAFEPSGVHDAGLEPFATSRPAATDLARETGEALGVKVKPEGNRRMQQVADRFLYWLRASRLETHRLSYWWANRMLNTQRPLEEKMSLFWHGHFATSEEKVRDYRKMEKQNAGCNNWICSMFLYSNHHNF